MSKYDALWAWIKENGADSFHLSFDEIQQISGVPIDHSFLTYKKELTAYGYLVKKISMKGQAVEFQRVQCQNPESRTSEGSESGEEKEPRFLRRSRKESTK